MQILKSTLEGTEAFTVQGQLDGTTAPQLEAVMGAAIQAKAPRFILDFGQVPLVSSATLRVLLSATKRMKLHGGAILLCALRPEVRRVFDLSGLSAFFEFHPTLDEAFAAARPYASPNGSSEPPTAPETTATSTPGLSVPEAQTVVPLAREVTAVARTESAPAPLPLGPKPEEGATVVPITAAQSPRPSSSTAAPAPRPPSPEADPVAMTSAMTVAPVAARGRTTAPPPPPRLAVPPITTSPPASVPKPAPPTVSGRPTGLRVGLGLGLLALVGGGLYLYFSTLRGRGGVTPSPTPIAVASPTPDATDTPPTPTVAADSPPPPFTSVDAPPSSSAETSAATTPGPSSDMPPKVENVTSAAGAVNFDQGNSENKSARDAVLQRIEAMPLAQKQKDQLYAAVNRARGMGKLLTANFASGKIELTPADVEKLKTALRQPNLQRLVNDPTVTFVVLGFADNVGTKQKNKEVSDRRAQNVVDALRGPCGMVNDIHSMGMGDLEMFGESREKNRVAEVWAVLP